MQTTTREISQINDRCVGDSQARRQKLAYFILAILGFSFWFLMAVPFASHRETYWWLATVHNESFRHAFSFISSTYRPLHQAVTWAAFQILDPGVFPTSVARQALLQFFVYGMFVLAWWQIYTSAAQARLCALLALVTGGVFFSGYVQLFHIYGLAYVPVVLTLGALLRLHAAGTFRQHEAWFGVVATLLVLWHPFATALFVGFYFGYCLETVGQRTRTEQVRAVAILLAGMTAVAFLVAGLPRLWPDASPLLLETATRPVSTRQWGLLVSYQTNEVNWIASIVSFVLTQMVVLSTSLSSRLRYSGILLVSALSAVFVLAGIPILLLWLSAVLIKLLRLRCWSLFFLTLTAALLPFGGGIGTPIYALFAIVVAAYATAFGWANAEKALSTVKTRYVIGATMAAMVLVILIRAGVEVPIVKTLATPLLRERERTYQLEGILAWLHASDYCGYEVGFVESADNPIDSVDSAISRRNRPPASSTDVRLFWRTVLQCQRPERRDGRSETAIVTFGGPSLPDSRGVFKVDGRYAGEATVWIRNSQK